MKSQIPGICAIVNEKITELEGDLDDLQTRADQIHDEFVEAENRLAEEQGVLRLQIQKYRACVSTLQDLRETLD